MMLRPRHPVALAAAVLAAGTLRLAPGAATEAGAAEAPSHLEIVYLANEGFLLTGGETKVLVDALFGRGLAGYASLTPAERAGLEAGRPPYDGVDVALASHYHRDHFDTDAVRRFLGANPQALFVSTRQAIEALDIDAIELGDRFVGYWPDEGEVLFRELADLSLRVFRLHHGRNRPDIQNLGLLLEICGRTVLHVGDTEADAADLRRAGLAGLAPDVALLPSWFLRPGPFTDAVEAIAPRRIVAMHLPTPGAPASFFADGIRDREDLVATIRRSYPAAFIPAATGDGIRIPCRLVEPSG